jgi:hypothetical protein
MPEVRIGSYPGRESVLRVQGQPDAVRRAVAELERVIGVLDADPGMRRLASVWQRGWRDRVDTVSTDPADDAGHS